MAADPNSLSPIEDSDHEDAGSETGLRIIVTIIYLLLIFPTGSAAFLIMAFSDSPSATPSGLQLAALFAIPVTLFFGAMMLWMGTRAGVIGMLLPFIAFLVAVVA